MCECEPVDDEYYCYLRVCAWCGTEWESLHCPHDGAQGRCPGCGRRPVTLPDP